MRVLFVPLLFLLLVSAQCKKDRHESPIDQLPPETQTGSNTFGCLVDGKVFKPGGALLSGGSLSCSFQYLGTGPGGGYYFRLAAVDMNNNTGEIKSIGIFSDSLKINNGIEYVFVVPRVKGSSYALYGFSTEEPPTIDSYETNDINSGRLTITRLDTSNQIVSGIFWFDAINENGRKIQVREGRFDVRYTR